MDVLRASSVTFAVFGLCILAYWQNGAASVPYDPIPISDVFLNVFMHGDIPHLLMNLVMLVLGGQITEQRIGHWQTFLLIIACIAVGTSVQLAMVDQRFVGISGPVYGLVTYAVIATAEPKNWWFLCLVILGVITLEILFGGRSIAIYAHIFSTLIGGSYAMFGSLFGSKGPQLKPMQLTHLSKVVQIIKETDDDDAAEAENEFLNDGIEDMFVLLERGEVLGVIGYSHDDQVDDVVWLSWTYLRKDCAGEGLGAYMLNDLLGKLKAKGIRKIFIATSDYDHFGKLIYAAAHKMYAEFGAAVELTIPAYHTVTEAKIVYGLDNPEFDAGPSPAMPSSTGISITGSALEPETEGVFGLTWQEAPVGLAGIDYAVDQVKMRGGRKVVLALPSDLSDANADTLKSHKFEVCGRLDNYYNFGLHQVWWICSLDGKY
ncbi:rhomboid family intramembrane serine protease [Yoonia maritima]|uniref:rhomboid family intramembrane serine protease n=1 Tax=Yoonia maritima TaxID=1435347 RepID=UPI0013A685B1|nr:rhomboid family intramembrane serine protease [Yoonia maritima]